MSDLLQPPCSVRTSDGWHVDVPRSVAARSQLLSGLCASTAVEGAAVPSPVPVARSRAEMMSFLRVAGWRRRTQSRTGAGPLDQVGRSTDGWRSASTPCLIRSATAADFLACGEVVEDVCAELSARWMWDTDRRLSDPRLAALPRACLEKVASRLDRDSAISFMKAWDVGEDTLLSRMRLGGARVCRHCVQQSVRRIAQSVACARDACVADQLERGEVFDAAELYPPVAIIAEMELGMDDDMENVPDAEDEPAAWLGVAIHNDADDSASDDDGSNSIMSMGEWIQALGLAAADPDAFVDANRTVIIQHDLWGAELEAVWRRQRREHSVGRTSPPPILCAAMIFSLGRAFSRVGRSLVETPWETDECMACSASRLGVALGPCMDEAMRSLALVFAERRARIDLRGTFGDDTGFVPVGRGRRRRPSPERAWARECADVPTLCSLLGVCPGCGLPACTGELNCRFSVGLTRSSRLLLAPNIRRFRTKLREEYASRLARSVPPLARASRRRRARAVRDDRRKCLVCRNTLSQIQSPATVSETGATDTRCAMCARCCRRPSCREHFPPEELAVYRRFAAVFPVPMLHFEI